jgi:hypothetical protein
MYSILRSGLVIDGFRTGPVTKVAYERSSSDIVVLCNTALAKHCSSDWIHAAFVSALFVPALSGCTERFTQLFHHHFIRVSIQNAGVNAWDLEVSFRN